jgi:hypothetical protein
LTSAGAGGGVPLKVDSGGAVQDPRERLLDFFVADTDTSRGSSGGGAFDDELALAGVMSRGDADLERTSDGCMVTVHQPDPAGAHEEFTYASHVIEGLCARSQASSLCREDCGDPCVALPPIPPPPAAGNCSIGAPRNASALFLTLLAGTALLRRRAAIARGARSFSSDSR